MQNGAVVALIGAEKEPVYVVPVENLSQFLYKIFQFVVGLTLLSGSGLIAYALYSVIFHTH